MADIMIAARSGTLDDVSVGDIITVNGDLWRVTLVVGSTISASTPTRLQVLWFRIRCRFSDLKGLFS